MKQSDSLKSGKMLKYLFYISLPLFALMDLLVPREPYFWFDGLPGFYAVFGFIMCILTIVVCKAVGYYWLMVNEEYYEDDAGYDSTHEQKGGIAF